MEDLIIFGKVISITDDINNPKLSSQSPFFMDAIVEIYKVLGGRFAVSYKDIHDTTVDDYPRASVIAVQFASEWDFIKFDFDQKGIFVLSVFGKRKFLAKHFEKR